MNIPASRIVGTVGNITLTDIECRVMVGDGRMYLEKPTAWVYLLMRNGKMLHDGCYAPEGQQLRFGFNIRMPTTLVPSNAVSWK